MLRKLKHRIQQVCHFSNNESNGLLAIIVLILLLIIAPRVYKLYCSSTNKPLDHSPDIALLEKHLALLQANAKNIVSISINTATVAQLQEIRGISKQLAQRIIRYRDKLGGFVSSDQYKEVYGLSSHLQLQLMQKTTLPVRYKPKQLSLNQATFKTLVAHPYIPFSMAKAIVAYRKQQGPFTTLRAIQRLPGYDAQWGKKVMPYLAL